MELLQLKYFKTVAEIGKISDAAQALDDARVPQSDRYLYLSGVISVLPPEVVYRPIGEDITTMRALVF